MALSRVWVYVDVVDGEVAPISLELLTKARDLGDAVEAFTVAEGDPAAGPVGAHGATKLYATGDPGDALLGVAGAAAMKALIDAGDGPDLVLFGTTYDGRDIMGRLSAALDRPLLTNNVDVAVDGDTVVVTEPIFGGTENVQTKFTGEGPYLVSVRPKSFAAEESGGGPAEVVAAEIPDTGVAGSAKVTNRHVEEHEGPQLDEADVVVSGGRGLGDADKYQMIEDLAKLLGAAPGASRAIVDAGWVPYSYQVGQTGKVVKPTVYIACGISGATQHMVGMKGSKNIIAVNKDPDAPILGISDLGVVGDVHKVLPKLIEALQARK